MKLRKQTAHALLLLAPPVAALGVATYLGWSPTPAGRSLTAILTTLCGASSIAALAFALDSARIRRAFGHLRLGGGAMGYEPPERQKLRELRQHETIGQLRRQVEQLSAIRDLALIANDDVDLERILERALVVLGGLLDAREITIFLQDGEGLAAVAHRLGQKNRVRGKRPLKVEPEAAAEAIQERRTVVSTGKGVAPRAAALLVADGRVMGALEVRMARGPAGEDARELGRQLEGLAKHIALAISKPTLYDRAVVDSLTGLYTKRHFFEQARHYMAQRARLGTPLSLIILDVDHFKQVNDVHGHVAGDLVLAEVASRMRNGIRGYDLAFRYGGEEMIVLAPNTPLQDAVGLAERLRKALRRKAIDTGETEIKITASFGVAEFDPETAEDVAGFVEIADRCLYQAKRGGRDQVVGGTALAIDVEDAAPAEEAAEPEEPAAEDETTEDTAPAELPAPPEAFRTRSSAA